jgi:RNA 2',3'-cyclic 3'-phosphodiesterase
MALPFSAGARRPPPVARNERLFVALWPDAATRDALAVAVGKLGIAGRRVAPTNLHLTMAFLGTVSSTTRSSILKAMRDTRAGRFTVQLDRVGHFSASRAAWLGISNPPQAIVEIQRRLVAHLRSAGFTLEDRPFRAHVTVARDAAKPDAVQPEGVLPVAWTVGNLSLVRSPPRGGGQYQVLDSVTF